ncbi:MAG: hypothetical protein H0V96_12480 [Acidimicrobiia bacterium]|nr:hypothetical protein [Acidimicrobiia bacterium]
MKDKRPLYVTGELELKSPLFSSDWSLRQHDAELASIRRRHYTSVVDITHGGRIVIEPYAQGTVRAINGASEVARITRESWLGRRWEVTGPGFTYDLASQARPRHWRLFLANGPVSDLEGGFGSYNKVKIFNQMAVPLSAVLLAWHVVARPWEAVAEPQVFMPAP